MDHVAIDLGGRESQICVRRPNNDVQFERRIPTAKLKAFFKTLEPSRVIIESQEARVPIATRRRISSPAPRARIVD